MLGHKKCFPSCWAQTLDSWNLSCPAVMIARWLPSQQKRNLHQIGAFQLGGTSSQDGNVPAQMDWETQATIQSCPQPHSLLSRLEANAFPFFLHKEILKTNSTPPHPPHQSGNYLEIPERKELCTNVITGIVLIKYGMLGNSWGKPLPMKKGVSKDVANECL